MKFLFTIAGVDVMETTEHAIQYLAGAMVDSDGAPGNPDNDPHWQATTSLTYHGQPIDAKKVPYAVVPPAIIRAVPGVVLGCEVLMENIRTRQRCVGVVADVGPRDKLGELSCRAAELLGIPSSSRNGGTHEKIIRYTLRPGTPAFIDGVRYDLKPSRIR